MKNISKYNAIRQKLADYFDRHIYAETIKEINSFFLSDPYNNYSDAARELLQIAIRNIPIEKETSSITNQNIVALRKTYPRSHEPWKEKEIVLFHEAIEQTNDIEFLSLVFQRSPNSIKAAYENVISKLAATNNEIANASS